MDIANIIEEALKDDLNNNVLNFNNYRIEKIIGYGQQGVVLKVRNMIGRYYAIKIYRPTDTDMKILEDGVNRFIRETKILSSLQHKNIAKIFTAGIAILNGDIWKVEEGFPENSTNNDNQFYYYIMDYIEGEDLTTLFPELNTKSKKIESQKPHTAQDRIGFFETLITQVTSAISYYHLKDISHKDIKPDNIRYSKEDSSFLIVDFGFARHVNSPQDLTTFYKTEYLDIQSLQAGDYKKNDIAQFAGILSKLLPSFKSVYDDNRYKGMEAVLNKAKHHILERRYNSVDDFYNSLSAYFMELPRWRFLIRLDEYLTDNLFGRFDSKLRIPVDGSMLLTKEVRKIIDTPTVQRLRGVRQLGPTIFVFPGANHTRFEHSLGSYFLSLKYIESLVRLPFFKEVCEPIDETIKLLALSALLHDIGHYPYSHWIEEIDQFPNGVNFPHHEERAKELITREPLQSIIRDDLGIDPDVLSNIIANKHLSGNCLLVNTSINSIIDIDKIDYLRRDSIHCGVNYGKGLDIERILDSLYINPEINKLCLTDKGRSSLLSILSCRNIMYQEVYWHKTVRACDAMFKRFFYEYIKNGTEDNKTIQEYFNYSDDHFIGTLYEKSKEMPGMNRLIAPFAFKGRILYKPAYIFYKSSTISEPEDTINFFKKVLNTKSYSDLIVLSEQLVEKLKSDIPDIKPLDIIIEMTPIKEDREFYSLQGFKFWNIRKKRYDNYPSEIDSLNNYLKNNAQAYIFCNPNHYEILKKMSLSNRLNEILAEL